MKFTNFHLVSFFLSFFFFLKNEGSGKELLLSLCGYKEAPKYIGLGIFIKSYSVNQ